MTGEYLLRFAELARRDRLDGVRSAELERQPPCAALAADGVCELLGAAGEVAVAVLRRYVAHVRVVVRLGREVRRPRLEGFQPRVQPREVARAADAQLRAGRDGVVTGGRGGCAV